MDLPIAFATASHGALRLRCGDATDSRSRCTPLMRSGSSTPRVSRRSALSAVLLAAVLPTLPVPAPTKAVDSGTTPTGLVYSAVKHGDGPAANVGDLVGIRFKGTYNGRVFDDLFGSTDPYYYRVGSENILKGIDEAVQFMRVGDVYNLTLPSTLAFGKKGRRASAGKPSIPPDAEVQFVLELSGIPGREDELLEAVGE